MRQQVFHHLQPNGFRPVGFPRIARRRQSRRPCSHREVKSRHSVLISRIHLYTSGKQRLDDFRGSSLCRYHQRRLTIRASCPHVRAIGDLCQSRASIPQQQCLYQPHMHAPFVKGLNQVTVDCYLTFGFRPSCGFLRIFGRQLILPTPNPKRPQEGRSIKANERPEWERRQDSNLRSRSWHSERI
jgi:hypothetical protein